MKNFMVPAALVLALCFSLAARASSVPSPAERALLEHAFNGNLREVQLLVSDGTAVDAVDDKNRTPLMFAAFNGHTLVVEFLTANGANPDHRDSNGRTALIFASSGAFAETVRSLLKSGAKVNAQGTVEGFSALMTAASEGQAEVVRLLLAYGADPDLKDRDGDTARSFAEQNGHSVVIEVLDNPPPVIESSGIRVSPAPSKDRE